MAVSPIADKTHVTVAWLASMVVLCIIYVVASGRDVDTTCMVTDSDIRSFKLSSNTDVVHVLGALENPPWCIEWILPDFSALMLVYAIVILLMTYYGKNIRERIPGHGWTLLQVVAFGVFIVLYTINLLAVCDTSYLWHTAAFALAFIVWFGTKFGAQYHMHGMPGRGLLQDKTVLVMTITTTAFAHGMLQNTGNWLPECGEAARLSFAAITVALPIAGAAIFGAEYQKASERSRKRCRNTFWILAMSLTAVGFISYSIIVKGEELQVGDGLDILLVVAQTIWPGAVLIGTMLGAHLAAGWPREKKSYRNGYILTIFISILIALQFIFQDVLSSGIGPLRITTVILVFALMCIVNLFSVALGSYETTRLKSSRSK